MIVLIILVISGLSLSILVTKNEEEGKSELFNEYML